MQPSSEDIKERHAAVVGLVRSNIFALHGGEVGFDLWLNETADIMAKPETLSEPPAMWHSIMPSIDAELAERPYLVVDYMLNTLHKIRAWAYRVQVNGDIIQVIDPACGHVIEELTLSNENLQSLAKKYGVEDATISAG